LSRVRVVSLSLSLSLSTLGFGCCEWFRRDYGGYRGGCIVDTEGVAGFAAIAEKWRKDRVLKRGWWLREGLATTGHGGPAIEGSSVATSRS